MSSQAEHKGFILRGPRPYVLLASSQAEHKGFILRGPAAQCRGPKYKTLRSACEVLVVR